MSEAKNIAYLTGGVRKLVAIEPDEFDDESGHGYDALERWHDRDARARERDDQARLLARKH